MGAAGDEARGHEVLPQTQPLSTGLDFALQLRVSAPLVGKLQSDWAIQGLAESWPPCGAGKKKGRQEQVFQNARTALLETVPVSEGRTAAKAEGLLLPDWEIGGFSAAELALSQYGVEQRPERLGGERAADRMGGERDREGGERLEMGGTGRRGAWEKDRLSTH